MRYQRSSVYGIEYRIHDPKPYGFWNFMGDIFMTVITSGLWLIWIFVREMRRR